VIVLVHGAPAFGAVERYIETIAAALLGSGEEVALVYPDAAELAPLAALAGANVRTLPFAPAELAQPTPLQAVRLARRLRRLQPRVVHVMDVWATGQIATRLARSPRLLVTHHTPELPRDDSVFGRAWFRLGWLTRPEVIYTSDADQLHDSRRLVSHVIPYGIDLDRFARARPALRNDGPIIGTVARLAPQKGHRVLIDAAPLVLGRHPDARFVLVGDGEIRDELEQRVRDAGLADFFEFTGERDDVPELLASFDVFALPSFFEGLCFAVIEAQAAGIPVVATGVGGIVETVLPGETGIRCEPGDAGSLAEGILRILDDPAEGHRLAREARRRVRARYSVDRMVEETIALYR
jgi:glycosyltransferase involved in cell wall biosynthesis